MKNFFLIKFRLRRFLPEISAIILLAFLNLTAGCHYYKVHTSSPDDQGALQEIQVADRYVILHQGNNVWHLQAITINDKKREITGLIGAVSGDHQYFERAKTNIYNRYRPNQGNPYLELHVYITEYAEGEKSFITIPFSSIKKIEIYDKAKGATTASYFFTIFGSAAAVAGIVLAIASCPYIYVNDGNSYHFVGEMYGGAIHSIIERDDYMPLPGFTPVKGEYQLKIANELQERQYTDLAELMVIQHPENSEVLIDKYGKIHTLVKPEPPLLAFSDKNIDRRTMIMTIDSNYYQFNDDSTIENQLSSLTLSFKKPYNAQTGKLILNAKNSIWVDYIVENFNKQFGSYYNTYVKKQKNADPKKVIQWSIDQGLPLSVYLETNEGWKFIDYFNTVGPMAARDMVLPIDLSKVKGEDVRVKLECGFMFWELDYAAMDFSENLAIEISHISPATATDEKGNDVATLLRLTDKQYYIQPEVGNEAIISYKAPLNKNNQKQTAFLHSRGYYEYIRDYKEKPNFKALKTFKKKLAFTNFSKQKYFEIIKNNKLSMIITK